MPQIEGVNGDSLASIYRVLQHTQELYWQTRNRTVFRNRKLIAESYFKDEADRTTRQPVWSCTKQVMQVLIGIAIDRGLIRSINDPTSTYLPIGLTKFSNNQDISLIYLLTMRSGIGYVNYDLTSDDAAVFQQKPDNLLRYV